jgi:hypothetical protein
MIKTEKWILVVIVVCSIGMAFSLRQCQKQIEDGGGFKQLIIDAGREVKDIGEKIAAE